MGNTRLFCFTFHIIRGLFIFDYEIVHTVRRLFNSGPDC
ncbi:hypothetical protein FLA_1750 [Filimonas lacunae]|nr:hypothetical protein FLA_1750 [Filimonas lacunae]